VALAAGFELRLTVLSASQGGCGAATHVSGRLTDGAWHHVAVTVNGPADEVMFYIDGSHVETSSSGCFRSLSEPIAGGPQSDFIGAGGSFSCEPGGYFTGQIDELSFFRRALTAEEVGAIHAAGSAGKCPLPPVPATPVPVLGPIGAALLALFLCLVGVRHLRRRA
jgi:hypothetical protein